MKSKNILLGILAIMLIFTMTVVGCGEDPTDNNGNGNGNGGSTDYWAKFKNTEWVGGSGTASNGQTSTLTLNFLESMKMKYLNFTTVADSDPQANGYAVIEVEANKFICTNDNYTIDYTLSNDGKTLTLSNIGKSNKNQYEGTFTKK